MEPELNQSVTRMKRDIREAAATLSDNEARFLVGSYHNMQESRIRASNQIRALGNSEPHTTLTWLSQQALILEKNVGRALDAYSEADPIGAVIREVVGIGPVIAAGLRAHLDITKAPTASAFWRFAGLDPSSTWEKGQKRPWNAELKTLCWQIGQSFQKFSNHPRCFYGALYKERKAHEVARNEAGDFSGQAEVFRKKVGKTTAAYKYYASGKLPPAHVDARARRWVVKLFLSHLHAVWYEHHHGVAPPVPYIIAQDPRHTNRVAPPFQLPEKAASHDWRKSKPIP